jgi:hypothetical protein
VAETSVADSDWRLGIQARSRALVSDGEEAERSLVWVLLNSQRRNFLVPQSTLQRATRHPLGQIFSRNNKQEDHRKDT